MNFSIRIITWDNEMFILKYRWRKKDGKFVLLNRKIPPIEGVPRMAGNFAELMRDICKDIPDLKNVTVL